MRTPAPITILAGEDLEGNRRVMFNGTSWVYADAYDFHHAVTGNNRIASGKYGEAYPTNDFGIVDIEAAGSIAAGARLNGKDDGKCDDDGAGISLGVTVSAATIASGNRCPALCVPDKGGLLYAATGASTAIAASSTEALFDTGLTLPANFLKAGDELRVRSLAICTATVSTDTFRYKGYIGGLSGTNIFDTSTLDVSDNDIARANYTITVRTAGASGTAVAEGEYHIGTSGTATNKSFWKASFTLDTTAAQVLGHSGKWSTTNANSARQEVFSVELRRK